MGRSLVFTPGVSLLCLLEKKLKAQTLQLFGHRSR